MSGREKELDGYKKEELIETFKHFRTYRQNKENMWKKIKKFHEGRFWDDLKDKLPKHQILPDTNYLEYIEKNIVNSVYAGSYVANVLAKHYEDNDKAQALNAFLEQRLPQAGIKEMFPNLGTNAVLYNFSGIQTGWNADMISGSSKNREQGSVDLSFVPHNQLYFDPSVTNYQNGRALFRSRNLTIFDLLNEESLKEGAKEYVEMLSNKDEKFVPVTLSPDDTGDIHKETTGTSNEFTRSVNLLECFYKVDTESGYRIDQVFIVDQDYVLHVKKGIKPKKFPITVLYGETPVGDPYGTPQVYKVMANIVSLNMLDSLEATHGYNTQNRTKLVNLKSGINYRMFSKHGNTPHLAFPVHGNPKEVVQYVDVQALPDFTNLKIRLEQSIFTVTGVDPRYIGRDTGSIQTTGGTDLAQQRIVSMTDSLRIINLEHFVEELTRTFIDYYIEYGNKYTVAKHDKGTGEAIKDEDVEVNFEDIKSNVFEYTMNATPHLPKSKMRLSEAADHLMELQGQYQYDPPIITPSEWLSYKDFPQKHLQLQRMRADSERNDQQELVNDLQNFAGLIDKGLQPQEAIQIMLEEKQAMKENPELGREKKPMGGPM